MTNPSPGSTLRHRLLLAAVATTLAVTMAACSSDSSNDASTDTTAGTGTTVGTGSGAAASGVVTVSDAWARTSPTMQGTGAAYMQITGGAEDEELVGASVPASVAGSVELHETSTSTGATGDSGDSMDMGDMDMGSDMGDDMDMGDMDMSGGMMTMRQISSIPVPAGATVTLEPGGLHMMLIDLAAPLVAGESFELTLEFASGATVRVPVDVRSNS